MSRATGQVSRDDAAARPDRPSREAAERLARWLAGPRSRLLRRAQIGQRRAVLEVGCGHGVVTEELLRRCGGDVVCLDRDAGPARCARQHGAKLVEADAGALPFHDESFDLVFCQNVLLWVGDVESAVAEMARVLQQGGAIVTLEPDYGGMVECPPEIALQDLWLEGLRAAGAEPLLGRRLPGLFETAGLDVWCELQSIPQPPTGDAARLLLDLPLSEAPRARALDAARALDCLSGTWRAFVHVPYFLVIARK